MVDATRAVEIADESIKKVVPTFAALGPHVEEIQQSRNGDTWMITFRAENPEPKSTKGGFSETFYPYIEKVVSIAIQSGDLLSVRNPDYE